MNQPLSRPTAALSLLGRREGRGEGRLGARFMERIEGSGAREGYLRLRLIFGKPASKERRSPTRREPATAALRRIGDKRSSEAGLPKTYRPETPLGVIIVYGFIAYNMELPVKPVSLRAAVTLGTHSERTHDLARPPVFGEAPKPASGVVRELDRSVRWLACWKGRTAILSIPAAGSKSGHNFASQMLPGHRDTSKPGTIKPVPVYFHGDDLESR
jgi:hypothetical protein